MEKEQITRYTDYPDGTPMEDGAGRHFTFSIDRRSFEIDLTDKNADKFYAALAPYVDAARSVTSSNRTARRARKAKSGHDLSAVRKWARANNRAVSESARVPSAVLEAYEAADS